MYTEIQNNTHIHTQYTLNMKKEGAMEKKGDFWKGKGTRAVKRGNRVEYGKNI